MDAFSRVHSFRKWPKTVAWIERYFRSDLEQSQLGSYQFFKFHALRGYTFPNLVAGMYGNYDDAYRRKMKRLDSFFKKKGYMTGFTNNACELVELLRQNGSANMPYVDPEWPDHQMVETACEHNSLNYE